MSLRSKLFASSLLVTVMGVSTTSQAVLTHHYTFDNADIVGTKGAGDVVGTSDATPTGTLGGENILTGNLGLFGQAYSFTDDGGATIADVENLLAAPTGTAPFGSAERTIAVWFNQTEESGQDKLFGYGDPNSDGDGATGDAFAVGLELGGIRIRNFNGNIAYGEGLFDFTGADVGWHHLAVRVNAGATTFNDVDVFLDGVQLTMGTVNGDANNDTIATIDSQFGIGNSTVPGGFNFQGIVGLLDDLRIYDNALTNGEIATLAVKPTLPEWALAGSGSWDAATAGNWATDPTIPGVTSPGDIAVLGTSITVDATVTVDTAVDVGSLYFTTVANSYTVVDGTGSLTLSGSALVNVQGGTHEIASGLNGTVGLTKAGAGTLILSGSNSGLSGTMNIQTGVVQMASVGAQHNGNTNVEGTLILEDGFDGNFSGDVTGSGQVTVDLLQTDVPLDIETVTFTGDNSAYAGNFTVNEGVLAVDSANDLGDATGTTTVGGSTGVVDLTGTGLSIAENFSIGTRAGNNFAGADLLAHIRNSGASNTLTGSITTTGNSFHNIEIATGSSLTISNTVGAPAVVTNEDGTLRFKGDGNAKIGNEAAAGAGRITGSGNVLKEGAGTLTIATAATVDNITYVDFNYTGSTTVAGGTLEVLDDGADNGELFSSSINVQSGTTLDVDDFGTYSLQPVVGQNLGGAGTVKANTLQVLEGTSVTPGDSVGTLTVDGNLRLTYVDTSTLNSNNDGRLNFELTSNGNGANDLIDVVNTTGAGNLDIFMNESLLDQFVVNVIPVDGVLDTVNNYTLIQYAGALNSGLGNGDGSNFTANVVDNLGNTLTTRHTFSVSTATSGEVQLDVNGAALTTTWIGGSTGLWDVDDSGTDWDSDSNLAGDTDFHDLDHVTFDNNGVTKTVSISSPVAPGSITINNSAGNDYTFTGAAINGFGGITKSGAGMVTINNANNTFSGGIQVNAGAFRVIAGNGAVNSGDVTVESGATYQLGDGSTGGNAWADSAEVDLVLNGGQLIADEGVGSENIQGVVSGAGSVRVDSARLMLSNSANSYSGGTVVNGGTLESADGGAFGTGGVTLNAGGRMQANGETHTIANDFVLNGGTYQVGGGTASALTQSGNLTVGSADATVILDPGTDTETTNGLTITGNIGGAGGNALTLSVGSGSTLAISGAVGHDGNTTVTGGGTVALQGSSSIGSSPSITVDSGSTLDVSATTSGGMTLSGSQNLALGGAVEGDVTLQTGTKAAGEGRVGGNLTAESGSTVQIGDPSITFIGTLITSDFDGNTGASVLPGNADNTTGSANVTVTWTTDSSITNPSALTAVAPASGFAQTQGGAATFANPNVVYVNHNMNIDPRSDQRGYSFTFDAGANSVLDNLQVLAGHTNNSGNQNQGFTSTLNVSIDNLTDVANVFTGSSVEDQSLAPAYHAVDFDLSSLSLVAGKQYRVTVTMSDLVGGGAYATYDGLTLTGGVALPPAPTVFDLQVDGDYTQQAGATLEVDIFNTDGYDRLTVGGTATLGGGLNINQENEMALGDEVVILTSNILSGNFDQTQITGFELPTPSVPSAVAVLYEDSGDVDTDADQVRLFATYRGDANGDGDVDLIDLDRLGSNWFSTPGTVTWGQADFNYDGDVDLLDLNVLGQNWFATPIVAPESAAPAVPEPASVLLLGLGALALSRKRRG